MKKNIINSDLITGIDILNTLYGGSIEPAIKLTQFPEYRQIEVWAPSIEEENLHVKITNNQLVIFYELNIDTQGKVMPVPQVVYSKPIPFFINADNISARYIDHVLTVQLPYNELANGQMRDIPINN